MKCFFRLLLLASVPARAPIRGKAGAFAALLLNISPLFTLSLGSALVSVLVAGADCNRGEAAGATALSSNAWAFMKV